ncbi:hypothetical protein DVA67_016955 [Solirubrobacter sp. CPCC 204708]|nr:hypothetical protein [Solirubrobacter deserti]
MSRCGAPASPPLGACFQDRVAALAEATRRGRAPSRAGWSSVRRSVQGRIRGTGAIRTADFQQHFQLRDLILAGDRAGAADLMRRHVEASLPSAAAD